MAYHFIFKVPGKDSHDVVRFASKKGVADYINVFEIKYGYLTCGEDIALFLDGKFSKVEKGIVWIDFDEHAQIELVSHIWYYGLKGAPCEKYVSLAD